MQVFYTPRYYADIGNGHVFPIRKFELVRDRLLAEGTLDASELVEPTPATIEDVLLVHTKDYVSRLCDGTLTQKELRRLGLPWSESLVQRSFYATGGTLAATEVALVKGYGSNLAGGTHHSFADRGEGFCVLNDVAIAIRAMRARNGFDAQRSSIATSIRAMALQRSSLVTKKHLPFRFTALTTIHSSKRSRR